MTLDVVVVGAGPTGLMLACELSLAGVRPVVLERRPDPIGLPKANGLVGQIVQMLDYRGLFERFSAESRFAGSMPTFPFGSVGLDFSRLNDNPLQGMLIPQPRMEHLLAQRADELGVPIRRGHDVLALSQDGEGVTLDVRGPGGEHRLHARYLVGCDGAHSRVRAQAGIEFPGTTDSSVMRLGHVILRDSVIVPGGDLDVAGAGRLHMGVNRTPRGSLTIASLQPGVHILAVREEDPFPVDLAARMTLEELQASIRRVVGADLPVEKAVWVSRTVGQSRQADRYRAGRVLLAGDAAHVFSAGGAALNIGMLDTVNLGWKLAAHIQGWAPSGLLDTYHQERHPVGRRALIHTRAQAALSAQGEDGEALRDLVGELLLDEQPLRRVAEMLQCSDVRYDMPGDGSGSHPLLGGFAPDLALTTATGTTRVAELMRGAKGVLLDLGGRPRPVLGDLVQDWEDRVDVVTARCGAAPAEALLIRPDGHVAWVGNAGAGGRQAGHGLRDALSTWFGAARRAN